MSASVTREYRLRCVGCVAMETSTWKQDIPPDGWPLWFLLSSRNEKKEARHLDEYTMRFCFRLGVEKDFLRQAAARETSSVNIRRFGLKVYISSQAIVTESLVIVFVTTTEMKQQLKTTNKTREGTLRPTLLFLSFIKFSPPPHFFFFILNNKEKKNMVKAER